MGRAKWREKKVVLSHPHRLIKTISFFFFFLISLLVKEFSFLFFSHSFSPSQGAVRMNELEPATYTAEKDAYYTAVTKNAFYGPL